MRVNDPKKTLRRAAKASKLGLEGTCTIFEKGDTCTTFEKEGTRTTFEKCGINMTLLNVDKDLSLSFSIFEKSNINVTLLNADKDLRLENHANHALTLIGPSQRAHP